MGKVEDFTPALTRTESARALSQEIGSKRAVRCRLTPSRSRALTPTAPWPPARAMRAAIPMTWSPCGSRIPKPTCGNASMPRAASGVRGSGCGTRTGRRCARLAYRAASSIRHPARTDICIDIATQVRISISGKLYMRIYGFSI